MIRRDENGAPVWRLNGPVREIATGRIGRLRALIQPAGLPSRRAALDCAMVSWPDTLGETRHHLTELEPLAAWPAQPDGWQGDSDYDRGDIPSWDYGPHGWADASPLTRRPGGFSRTEGEPEL